MHQLCLQEELEKLKGTLKDLMASKESALDEIKKLHVDVKQCQSDEKTKADEVEACQKDIENRQTTIHGLQKRAVISHYQSRAWHS